MSTPANIAELDKNGRLHIINVAMDGDTSSTGVGPRLNVAYNDPKKVRNLVSMGNLAHVGFTTKQANAFKEGGIDWARYAGVDNGIAGKGVSEAQAKANRKTFDRKYGPVSDFTHAFNRDWGRKHGENGVVIDTHNNKNTQDVVNKVYQNAPMAGEYTYLYNDKDHTWSESYHGGKAIKLRGALDPAVNAKVLTHYINFKQHPVNPDIPKLTSKQVHHYIEYNLDPIHDDSVQRKYNEAKGDLSSDKISKKFGKSNQEKIDHDKDRLKHATKALNNVNAIRTYSIFEAHDNLRLYPRQLNYDAHTGDKLTNIRYKRHPEIAIRTFLDKNPKYARRLNVYTHNQATSMLTNKANRIRKNMPNLRKMGLSGAGKDAIRRDESMMDGFNVTHEDPIFYSGKSFNREGSSHKTLHQMSPKEFNQHIEKVDPYNEKLKSALNIHHDRSAQILNHYPKYAKELNMYSATQAKNYLQNDIKGDVEFLNNPSKDQRARIKASDLKPAEIKSVVNSHISNNKEKLKNLRPGVYTGEQLEGSADSFKPVSRKSFNMNVNAIAKRDTGLKSLNYASHDQYRTLNEMSDLKRGLSETKTDRNGITTPKVDGQKYLVEHPEITRQLAPYRDSIDDSKSLKKAVSDERFNMIDNIADKKGFYRNDFGRRLNGRYYGSNVRGVIGGAGAKRILKTQINNARDLTSSFDNPYSDMDLSKEERHAIEADTKSAPKRIPKYKAMAKKINPIKAYRTSDIVTKTPDVNAVKPLEKDGVKEAMHHYFSNQMHDNPKPHASAEVVKDAKDNQKLFKELDDGLSEERSDAEMDAMYPHSESFASVDSAQNYDLEKEINAKHPKAYQYHTQMKTYRKNIAHNDNVLKVEHKDFADVFPVDEAKKSHAIKAGKHYVDKAKDIEQAKHHKSPDKNEHGKNHSSKGQSSLEDGLAKTFKSNHEKATRDESKNNSRRNSFMSSKRSVSVKSRTPKVSRSGQKKDHGRK